MTVTHQHKAHPSLAYMMTMPESNPRPCLTHICWQCCIKQPFRLVQFPQRRDLEYWIIGATNANPLCYNSNSLLQCRCLIESLKCVCMYIWLVASTPLKNISQLGLLFPIKTCSKPPTSIYIYTHVYIYT